MKPARGSGSFADFRLPPGRHRLSQEQVAANQRWRLLGAAAEVVAEQGYLHTKASDVSRCAGVSRTTFYKYFDDLPLCLLAAYEMTVDCVRELIAAACESEGEWEARLRLAVDSVLEFFVAEPTLACLFGSQPAAGVPQIAIARANLIDRLCPLLASGRTARENGADQLPASAEKHLIAGALSVVSDRIADGDVERLPSLAPALVEILSTPYRTALAR